MSFEGAGMRRCICQRPVVELAWRYYLKERSSNDENLAFASAVLLIVVGKLNPYPILLVSHPASPNKFQI